MSDTLVSFETAELAKEKGFTLQTNPFGYVTKFYRPSTKTLLNYGRTGRSKLSTLIYAPTQSLLQRWLREVHGIDVIALPTYSEKYIFRLYQKGTICKNQIYGNYMSKDYANYEEALEKGLFQALKLIENE